MPFSSRGYTCLGIGPFGHMAKWESASRYQILWEKGLKTSNFVGNLAQDVRFYHPKKNKIQFYFFFLLFLFSVTKSNRNDSGNKCLVKDAVIFLFFLVFCVTKCNGCVLLQLWQNGYKLLLMHKNRGFTLIHLGKIYMKFCYKMSQMQFFLLVVWT